MTPDLIIISSVALSFFYYLQCNYEKSDAAYSELGYGSMGNGTDVEDGTVVRNDTGGDCGVAGVS